MIRFRVGKVSREGGNGNAGDRGRGRGRRFFAFRRFQNEEAFLRQIFFQQLDNRFRPRHHRARSQGGIPGFLGMEMIVVAVGHQDEVGPNGVRPPEGRAATHPGHTPKKGIDIDASPLVLEKHPGIAGRQDM